MKEEPLLLLSDLQKLINQVVLIDYIIIILGDNYFVDVYRFVMDIDEKDLHLQEAETDGYMFATLDEIKAFAAEGKFLHYDSIKKAFEM